MSLFEYFSRKKIPEKTVSPKPAEDLSILNSATLETMKIIEETHIQKELEKRISANTHAFNTHKDPNKLSDDNTITEAWFTEEIQKLEDKYDEHIRLAIEREQPKEKKEKIPKKSEIKEELHSLGMRYAQINKMGVSEMWRILKEKRQEKTKEETATDVPKEQDKETLQENIQSEPETQATTATETVEIPPSDIDISKEGIQPIEEKVEEATFKKNADGSVEFYSETGILLAKELADGTIEEYYASNNKIKQKTWPDGTFESYDPEGKLIQTETIDTNLIPPENSTKVLLDGSKVIYDEHGTILKKILPDGSEEIYDKDGVLESKIFRKKGEDTATEGIQSVPENIDKTSEATEKEIIRKEDIEDAKFEDIPKNESSTKNAEKGAKNKFDTKKAAEKINAKIAEEELKNGKAFSPEEKETLARELYLIEQENFKKENLGRIRKTLEKTQDWWKKLDETKGGQVTKVALSAGIIASTTLAAAYGLGITPSGTVLGSVLSKVGSATGVNMAVTSGVAEKVFNIFKKNGKDRKIFNQKNVIGAISVSAAFMISGGLVGGIAAGGLVLRRVSDSYIEKKIEKIEDEMKATGISEINESSLEKFGKEHDAQIKRLRQLKLIKGSINGALTIGSGLATMAVMHHNAEVVREHEQELKQEEYLKNETDLKHQVEAKQQAEIQHQAELKAKIEEQIRIKDAIVHKNEGIEHSFIRQIEHNPELAEELGYKGDVSDLKALHEFAGKEAHILAVKEGYVDNAGHEVWVNKADNTAYEIKMENGHAVIDEKSAEGNTYIHSAGNLESHTDTPQNVPEIKPVTPEGYIFKHDEVQNIHHENSTHNTDTRPINHEQHSEIFKPANTENSTVTDIHGRQFSAEDWIKAAQNPYHLSPGAAMHVVEMHHNNIDHLTNGSSLTELDRENLNDMIIEGDAHSMLHEDVKNLYKPLQDHIKRLHEVTGLEPREEAPFQTAETTDEYIYRAEMKAASMGKLEAVTYHQDPQPAVHHDSVQHESPKQSVSNVEHSKTVEVKNEGDVKSTITHENTSGLVKMTPETIKEVDHLTNLIQSGKISSKELTAELEKIKGSPLDHMEELSVKSLINNPNSPLLRDRLLDDVRILTLKNAAGSK